MKCPYANPTIQQCENFPMPDCARDERQDENQKKTEWIRNNPDKRKAIRRKYYLNNIETEKQRRKEWYAKNKGKVIARQKEKRDKNKKLNCQECEFCKEILDTKNIKRNLCIMSMRMVSKKLQKAPRWCSKRKKAERVS